MGPVATRARLGVCFGTAFISLACGGASMDAGGGGGSSGTGGAASGGSATGGAASGGSNATGGAASGGSSSTGGTSGTGGSGSGVEWDEVRCWQYQDTDGRVCYGRVGNLWTPIELACALESESRRPMDLSTNECGSEDISTPWHETWCHEVECYGRLGDWAARLRAACEIPDETPSGATPSEMFCAGAVEAPVGWDDVQCVAATGPTIDYCWGFIGMYFPDFGLFPTCYVEAKMAADPDFTEVTPDAGGC